MLGAAIVLPDHPQLAPESRGGLFDATEIEEALLLHVQALSDGERAEIAERRPGRARDDRARRARDARGRAAPARPRRAARPRVTTRAARRRRRAPCATPARRGARSTVDGRTFRRGGSVVLRPGPEADLHARMLDGRTRDDRADLRRLRRQGPPGRHVDGDPARSSCARRAGSCSSSRPRWRWWHDATGKQILVAGIGNAWLRDDGFGGAVAERLTQRELPPEAAVFDFGTGGLDLAYEVMRGYDALILSTSAARAASRGRCT